MVTRPDVLRYRVVAQLAYLKIVLKVDLSETYDRHLHEVLRTKQNKQERNGTISIINKINASLEPSSFGRG